MSISYGELSELVKKSEAPLCVAVSGEDVYWRKKALDLLSGLCDPFDLSVVCPPESVSDALFKLSSYGIFGKRVVVLREFFDLKENDRKELEKYAKNPFDGAILVFDGDLSKVNGFVQVVCDKLKTGSLKEETESLFKNADREIEDNAINLLLDYCEGDMARIEGEALKLMAYQEGRITTESVKEVVVPEVSHKIYDLTDAVAKGDYKTAFTIIERGDFNEGALLSSITTFYRNVFYCKISNSPELASWLGLKPYPMKKAIAIGRSYTAKNLFELLSLLYRLEFDIRLGKTTVDQALELAVAEAIERRQ